MAAAVDDYLWDELFYVGVSVARKRQWGRGTRAWTNLNGPAHGANGPEDAGCYRDIHFEIELEFETVALFTSGVKII